MSARTRIEPWGAWVRLDVPAALVALDREGARMLGLDGGDAWEGGATAPSPPLEAHVAVTSRCGAGCEGCYLDARPDGAHVPVERLLRTLDALSAAGVMTVAFGGGEPILRDDLGRLASYARAAGLVPVLTTSGLGLTKARAEELRAFAQVNVSYDGAGEVYAAVRGFDAAAAAERAIALLAAARVPVGVNVVLTRGSFPHLEATLRRARALGAREAQLLRYKPAGRAARLDYLAQRLDAAQVAAFASTLRALAEEHRGALRLRIDCALLPFLSLDRDLSPDALAARGVFGCEAGGALVAVRADGRVAPCSFAGAGVAAGERFGEEYAGDPELERFRAWARAPEEPCASCSLRTTCRGGCKVVTSFLHGRMGPDPECPRVVAHARGEELP
jgi:radical SAM protein with 4Fe4S-binding SPASM domain